MYSIGLCVSVLLLSILQMHAVGTDLQIQWRGYLQFACIIVTLSKMG